MLSGKEKWKYMMVIMSSASKITLCEMFVLFQVAVIYFMMLCKCLKKEPRTNCFRILLFCD